MLLSLLPPPLLLLLVVRGSQATDFLGTVMTYYPEETRADGSISVILRYKLNFASCSFSDTWQCGGNCGTENQTLALSFVEEVSGEWCQIEAAITHLLPNNTGFQTVLAGGNWISNIQNGIVNYTAVTAVELRNRSDNGKPNSSPQTTILPALRIPSNCPKTINLLAFDPDGDEVKCRYAMASESECVDCTPPSVLNLSSSCSLSFSPTNSSNSNQAVQLVMEDFPTQFITLTDTDGSQGVKTTSDAISKIPLQFVLKVGPTLPSCAEGLYLPRFLSPTPSNRAQLYTPAGQALEISIRAEATQSYITGLLYSGPYNVVNNSSGSGNFSLTWTPSASEEGQSHPVCFVVQTSVSGTLYHSDLRCVIVTVGNTPITQPPIVVPPTAMATTPLISPTTSQTLNVTSGPTTMTPAVNATSFPTFTTPNATLAPTSASGPQYVIALNMKISTTLSLANNSDTIINLIKNKMVDLGLPQTISLHLLSSNQVVVTTASP